MVLMIPSNPLKEDRIAIKANEPKVIPSKLIPAMMCITPDIFPEKKYFLDMK
jgi:hypothetical protein